MVVSWTMVFGLGSRVWTVCVPASAARGGAGGMTASTLVSSKGKGFYWAERRVPNSALGWAAGGLRLHWLVRAKYREHI